MKAFIDEHRGAHGVEPVCRVLQIAPSTYREHAARKADPERRSRRAKTDEALMERIEQVCTENFEVYGVRKVWQQLRRQGVEVARCTVQRLMKRLGPASPLKPFLMSVWPGASGFLCVRRIEAGRHREQLRQADGHVKASAS